MWRSRWVNGHLARNRESGERENGLCLRYQLEMSVVQRRRESRLAKVPSRKTTGSRYQRSKPAATCIMLLLLCCTPGCSSNEDSKDDTAAEPTQNSSSVQQSQTAEREDVPLAPEDVLRELHAQGALFNYRHVWPADVPLQIEVRPWLQLSKVDIDGQLPEQFSILDCQGNVLTTRSHRDHIIKSDFPYSEHCLDSSPREVLELPMECNSDDSAQVSVLLDDTDGDAIAVALPVTFVVSVDDILDTHMDQAYGKRLDEAQSNAHFYLDSEGLAGRLALTIPMPPEPATAVALDVELRAGGELFHRAQVLCGSSCWSRMDSRGDTERPLSLDMNGEFQDARSRLDDGEPLTVTLRCNPTLALQDFKAKRVWVGEDVTITMDRVAPDGWWSNGWE